MKRLNEAKFSKAYSVRLLDGADIPAIYALCSENDQFYAWCAQPLSMESIQSDLSITPPGKSRDDKYYAGFFDEDRLCAVLDLIDGYPDETTAFIGFFMMAKKLQGAGRGSAIIAELCEYLRRAGFSRVRLGINRGNPQSTHFWKKNGFVSVKEIEQEEGAIILAQKALDRNI